MGMDIRPIIHLMADMRSAALTLLITSALLTTCQTMKTSSDYCGGACIIYNHDKSFPENLRRLPVDTHQDSLGYYSVTLPGFSRPVDWAVDTTLAHQPVSIKPEDIYAISILQPTRITWGKYGVAHIITVQAAKK